VSVEETSLLLVQRTSLWFSAASVTNTLHIRIKNGISIGSANTKAYRSRSFNKLKVCLYIIRTLEILYFDISKQQQLVTLIATSSCESAIAVHGASSTSRNDRRLTSVSVEETMMVEVTISGYLVTAVVDFPIESQSAVAVIQVVVGSEDGGFETQFVQHR
jgi:hypothetical protein